MIRTTPFHDRTSAANLSGLWEHWSGYLVAQKYQLSEKFEYFAIRNSAGLFDSSPLYKYRVHGPDAEAFLAGVLARDIRACTVGRGVSCRIASRISSSHCRAIDCVVTGREPQYGSATPSVYR